MDIQQAFKEVTGLSVEEGIEKAIEGGLEVYTGELHHCNEKTLLNPLYWKSIGKAMGWREYAVCRTDGVDKCYDASHRDGYRNESIYHWHRFIDALAE